LGIEGNQGSNNRTFTGTTVSTNYNKYWFNYCYYDFIRITGNVQTQLNAKLTAATGTANYLQK
jgi:hypothetical protein